VKRFWSKVEVARPDDCWAWTASRNPDGYGRFALNGRMRQAHRVAWFLHYGEPGQAIVRHRCHNRACVNPTHLEIGTQAENIADMVSAGRQAKGCGHGQAKLNDSKAREVKAWLHHGYSQRSIARAYGVSVSAINQINTGKTWKHL
jgi:hypothetical protein